MTKQEALEQIPLLEEMEELLLQYQTLTKELITELEKTEQSK